MFVLSWNVKIMEYLSVFLVICASYLAGSAPIDRAIGLILRNYCPICGKRSDHFVRSVANILKGGLVVSLIGLVGHTEAQIATIFVFLGHLYPIQHRLQGGNGMAILLGAMIGLNPLLGLLALLSWLFAYFVFRFSSLAAVMSAVATTMCNYYIGLDVSMSLMLLLTTIVILRHRESLIRVAEGTEEMVIWD